MALVATGSLNVQLIQPAAQKWKRLRSVNPVRSMEASNRAAFRDTKTPVQVHHSLEFDVHETAWEHDDSILVPDFDHESARRNH